MGHNWEDVWVEIMISDIGKILEKYLEQENNLWKVGYLDYPLGMQMGHHKALHWYAYSKIEVS